MDIKVFIPAPTFYLQFKKVYSLNGKGKNISSVGKVKWNKIKIESMTLNLWMNMEKTNNHHPRVHFINNKNGSLVFNLWKRGETSSTTSLLLIRTSSNWWFPDISVFTSSGSSLCSNEEWFRNPSVFTIAQHSNSISDVTRIVATEHVRNKCSLREPINLKSVVVLITSM